MQIASPTGFVDAAFTGRHFGGNILASRDELNAGTGFEELVDELGVTSLRYPGGSLTEDYFDITRPDNEIVVNGNGKEVSFVSLSDFMEFAGEKGLSAVIVLPTRHVLSDRTDANGDRLVDLDEAALRGFVSDCATGVYGDVKIDAFEIGNEYWGSGQMSSVEYGRVAAEMSRVIDDELNRVAAQQPGADDIDIIVQSGSNFFFASLDEDFAGYGSTRDILAALSDEYGMEFGDESIATSGAVNWTAVANRLIINEFDTAAEREAVDGVVTHLYSKGSTNGGPRCYYLEQLNHAWDEALDDYEVYVTEWNQSASSPRWDKQEDFGLFQSHEMLNTLEEMVALGADQAQVWPLLQNSANTLSEGFAHDALTAPGEMFSMMSESLPGKVMLDFQPADSRVTEAEGNNLDVHGFYGDDELTFFIASTSDKPVVEEIVLSGLVSDIGRATVRVLGMAEGQKLGDTSSDAVVREIPFDEAFEDGSLIAELGPAEIMHVVISDFEPAEGFEGVMAEIDAALGHAKDKAVCDMQTGPATMIDLDGEAMSDGPVPMLNVPGDEAARQDAALVPEDGAEEEAQDGGGGGFDIGFAAFLLPILALAGLA